MAANEDASTAASFGDMATSFNFEELSVAYPPLKPHIFRTSEGSVSLNFRDPTAQRRLSEAILHRDFGLSLVLPPDRLCPPIPNRLSYVRWISDIVSLSGNATSPPVRGLDIGTGASAIYVLLACTVHRDWTMIGTDIDDISLQYAQENVRRNNLESRCEILRVAHVGPILAPFVSNAPVHFDFTMCNPPFYASQEEVHNLAATKEVDPNAVCTGSANEMITPGGEVNFIGRMIHESIQHGTRCRWYTSLIGKLSSVRETVHLLRRENIDNYGLTEILQGKTKRWAVVWSFDNIRLPDNLARPLGFALKDLIAPSTAFELQIPPHVAEAGAFVVEDLLQIDSLETISGPRGEITIIARRNTWSRAARRQQAQKISGEDDRAAGVVLPVLLECRASLESNEERTITLQWLRGTERALFESFWNHFKHRLEDRWRQTDLDTEMT